MSTRSPITRAYDAQTAVDREERTIIATINTAAVDRYRTSILPEGGRLDNYRKNPVVLYNHRTGAEGEPAFPIGKNLWIKIQNKRLVAKTKFLPEGKDETADKVFDLYDLGFLNAWSISFDPIEGGKPTPDEIRKRTELAECGFIYRAWDLLEYSCVTVPGNPEVTRQARAKGLWLPGWPDEERGAGGGERGENAIRTPPHAPPPAPHASLPPLAGRSFDDVLAAVTRGIRAEISLGRSTAARDAFDLARGMV